MRRAVPLLLLVALGFVVFGPLYASPKYSGGPVDNGGAIQGTVTIDPVPTPAEFAIGKDAQTCAAARKNPRLVVDPETKGLANVVVYLEGIAKGKARAKGVNAVIDQKNCQYWPHITIAPVKSRVAFGSSDPILHNVHIYAGTPDRPHSRAKDIANMAMKDGNVPDMPLSKRTMRKPGFYYVQCDAGHIWMSAYIWVVEHPYYVVTDAKGKYELKDVPAGTYTLRFWHENWQAKPIEKDGAVTGYAYGDPIRHDVQVTVTAGGAVTQDWVLRHP